MKALEFHPGCPKTQHCLLFEDDMVGNLMGASSSTAFPIYQNVLLADHGSLNPENAEQILRNAKILFDDNSYMYIEGVGLYTSPTGIGSYRAVPHSNVSGIIETGAEKWVLQVSPVSKRMQAKLNFREKWKHLGSSVRDVVWDVAYEFYPCSMIQKGETLSFPSFTGQAFIDSAKVEGTVSNMCSEILKECVGKHQQFSSQTDCENYMSSLPHVDPICEWKYGPFAVQGESLMCKFLHHFMAGLEPHFHCYHAGKGLPDMAGKRKCVVEDCIDENTPKELLIPGKSTGKKKRSLEHLTRQRERDLFAAPGDSTISGNNYNGTNSAAEVVTDELSDMGSTRSSSIQSLTRCDSPGTLSAPQCRTRMMSANSNATDLVEGAVEQAKTSKKKRMQCSSGNLEDLAAATVLAVQFCMPALVMGSCNEKCFQAVNTYLGRFAENGVLCSCDYEYSGEEAGGESRTVGYGSSMRSSALLNLLSIDAGTLVKFCSDQPLLFDFPTCIFGSSQLQGFSSSSISVSAGQGSGTTQCRSKQYLSVGNVCKYWDFRKVEVLFAWEWGDQSQKLGRRTKSNLIASAECSVFTSWYTEYTNTKREFLVPFYLQKHQSITSPLFIHPEGFGSMISSHVEYVEGLRSKQIRGPYSNKVGICWIGDRNDVFLPQRTVPILQSTDSYHHASSRRFGEELFPGLNAKGGEQYHQHFPASSDTYEKMAGKDLRKSISAAAFHSLLGTTSQSVSGVNFDQSLTDKHIKDFVDASFAFFLNEGFHRLHGHTIATAYKVQAYQIWRLMKKVFSEARMGEVLRKSNWTMDMTVEEGYRLGVDYVNPVLGIVDLLDSLIHRVRLDYCAVKELWQQDPVRFVLEHARMAPPVAGFVAKLDEQGASPRLYNSGIANYDESIFANPFTFNPNRANLDQVSAWNVLEQDYQNPRGNGEHTTLKRMCPARTFSMQFITQAAPKFFPTETGSKCGKNGYRVRHGVEFESERDAATDIEVWKVVDDIKKDAAKDNLMILLHDFPENPLIWSQFIAMFSVGENFHFWAPTYPGWGDSQQSRLSPDACAFPDLGKTLSKLIANAMKEWETVYLVGVGTGGILAWYATHFLSFDDASKLGGLIVLQAPHPTAFFKHYMEKAPWKQTPFYFCTEDALSGMYQKQVLEEWMDLYTKKMEYWNTEWQYDFQNHWEKTGLQNMCCSYRASFKEGDAGFPYPTDPIMEELSEVDPPTPILMLSAEHDPVLPQKPYMESLSLVSSKVGKLFIWHEVRGETMLNSKCLLRPGAKKNIVGGTWDARHTYKHCVDGVVDQVRRFTIATKRIKHSVWNLMVPLPMVSTAFKREAQADFSYAFAVVMVIVVILSGFALEIWIGPFLVDSPNKGRIWKFSQVFLVPGNFGALVSGSFLGLPLYVFCLFKFGFPELSSKLLVPIYAPSFFEGSLLKRVLFFWDGVATTIHHTSGTIIYAACLLHLDEAKHAAMIVWPLGFQHLFAVLKYQSDVVYQITTLGLELWFQFEAYALLPLVSDFAYVGICGLLFAHYMWIFYALVILGVQVVECRSASGKEEDDHHRGGKDDEKKISRKPSKPKLRSVVVPKHPHSLNIMDWRGHKKRHKYLALYAAWSHKVGDSEDEEDDESEGDSKKTRANLSSAQSKREDSGAKYAAQNSTKDGNCNSKLMGRETEIDNIAPQKPGSVRTVHDVSSDQAQTRKSFDDDANKAIYLVAEVNDVTAAAEVDDIDASVPLAV